MTTNKKASTHSRIFEDELLPHIEALHTFAYHLTYNEDDAADLVQETYLKAYRFIDKYDIGTNAKAWLFRILKNAYINEYRKKTRTPQHTDIDANTTTTADLGGDVNDLRHDIFENAMGDEITAALNALSVEFRTIILLCDVEGFSYEEMAQILDIPIGTVRSRLHRARQAFKELIRNYATTLGYNVEK
ncbi:MAG: sigma-70 family RNA polymerase sigma factor [Saprospiraceae bacterium]|nr:sigma-70 family RNA polymerase sigma factor [Saprospiraceae bacterium]MBP7679675.1 sigma-70 family RNA polymerase sigma factor [Saprospiraceae bacterium]